MHIIECLINWLKGKDNKQNSTTVE